MRVLVCGGRDFHDIALLTRVLDALHGWYGFTLLIHGKERGALMLIGTYMAALPGRGGIKECSTRASPRSSWPFPAGPARGT
jgi:YspA, cpYpsA-related SLOG family